MEILFAYEKDIGACEISLNSDTIVLVKSRPQPIMATSGGGRS